MAPEHSSALVEAAATDGVSFDELEVRCTGETFSFETPEISRGHLTEAELESIASGSEYVTNWYFWHASAPQREDYWTFLRWVEGASIHTRPAIDANETNSMEQPRSVRQRYERLADGFAKEWGQLLITVTLEADGNRRYRLRHAADASTDVEALEVHDRPRSARELARFDERGRYRPLKTAPTLRRGWAFEALTPDELLEAIEYLYPATVTNWYLEQKGDLDVTHWHETVTRQTGIYSLVERWDRGEGHEHVERVARACCDDSQCVKRREWEYDEATPLDVDGGDGEFPCREPCPLVIAAARKWTRLESEESQRYEFELTPSERDQLERIVDAVAEDRLDDIREADFDDPANRYRVRFLREKRFGDEHRDTGDSN